MCPLYGNTSEDKGRSSQQSRSPCWVPKELLLSRVVGDAPKQGIYCFEDEEITATW